MFMWSLCPEWLICLCTSTDIHFVQISNVSFWISNTELFSSYFTTSANSFGVYTNRQPMLYWMFNIQSKLHNVVFIFSRQTILPNRIRVSCLPGWLDACNANSYRDCLLKSQCVFPTVVNECTNSKGNRNAIHPCKERPPSAEQRTERTAQKRDATNGMWMKFSHWNRLWPCVLNETSALYRLSFWLSVFLSVASIEVTNKELIESAAVFTFSCAIWIHEDKQQMHRMLLRLCFLSRHFVI